MGSGLLQKALAALLAAAIVAGPAMAAPRAPCGGGRVHPCCEKRAGPADPSLKRAPCCEVRGAPGAPSAPAHAPRTVAPEAPGVAILPVIAPVGAWLAPVVARPSGEAAPGRGPPIRLRDCVFLL